MGPVEEEKKGKRLRPEHLVEDSTEEPKHAPRPGQLPLCLSRAGSPGT
uniref:GAGE domain-containing protein n=2 Tax=Onchocerca ochengi TaxID=42157 RepID=A0A182F0G2_ONCOC